MGVVQAKYVPHSAGHQCSVLHWILGFRELGWDVWIVENLRSKECRNEAGERCALVESINHVAWRSFLSAYNLEIALRYS